MLIDSCETASHDELQQTLLSCISRLELATQFESAFCPLQQHAHSGMRDGWIGIETPTNTRPGRRIEKVVLRRGAWSFLVQASVPGERKRKSLLGRRVTRSPGHRTGSLPSGSGPFLTGRMTAAPFSQPVSAFCGCSSGLFFRLGF